MGKRQETFSVLLAAAGYPKIAPPPYASTARMSEPARATVMDIYRRLGGRPEDRPIVSGGWDHPAEGSILIELDEQEHFHRHRALTLEGTSFPWSADYADHVSRYEHKCQARGGYWDNPRASAMFGPASSPGDHDGVGSPRWRQRALYDAVRDVWAQDNPTWRLARLSMYDVVDGVRLNEVLTGKHRLDPARLRELIESRTAD